MTLRSLMQRGELAGGVAVVIVAAALAITFVGATLPTPLYPLYQQAFGFSGITLTLIYAVYVLGNLVALLVFGRLSDEIGRRNATPPAIGVRSREHRPVRGCDQHTLAFCRTRIQRIRHWSSCRCDNGVDIGTACGRRQAGGGADRIAR